MKFQALECYYESLVQAFGIGSIPDEAKCDGNDIFRTNCSYRHYCLKDQIVDIKVRHCGDYFVYYLQPVRKLQYHKFFAIPKSGLYCGSEERDLPPPSGKFSYHELICCN